MANPNHALPVDAGPILLALARQAIAESLGVASPVPESVDATPPWLDEPGATFVTLTQAGALRGCIGTVERWRPLAQDLRSNAVAAALGDQRFPPLRLEELDRTHIEVSLLSTPEPMNCPDEAAAVTVLRPEVDGVVFRYDGHRATFLPQVWERLPDPRDFLAALRRKAGLPEDLWDEKVHLARYTVTAWEETSA